MVLRARLHFHLGASHGSYKPRQNIYFWNPLWSENRLVGLSFTLLQLWGAPLWKPDKTSVYQLIGEMHNFESDIIAFLAPRNPLYHPCWNQMLHSTGAVVQWMWIVMVANPIMQQLVRIMFCFYKIKLSGKKCIQCEHIQSNATTLHWCKIFITCKEG